MKRKSVYILNNLKEEHLGGGGNRDRARVIAAIHVIARRNAQWSRGNPAFQNSKTLDNTS